MCNVKNKQVLLNDVDDEFDTNEKGQIISYPLTSCLVASVDSVALICQLEYVLSREQFESGGAERLQLVMSAEQAQDLAELLMSQVNRLAAGTKSLPVM